MTDETPNAKPIEAHGHDVDAHGVRHPDHQDVEAHGFHHPDHQDVEAHMPPVRFDTDDADQAAEDVEAHGFRHQANEPVDEDTEAHGAVEVEDASKPAGAA